MSNKNDNNTDELNKKWKDFISTPTGRSQEEVQKEINDLYAEQQKLEDKLQDRLMSDLRKTRLVMNNFYNADTGKSKVKQVPIDGDVKAGSLVFMLNCSGCHSLEIFKKAYRSEMGFEKSIGPSLATVYNKPAGSNRDYMDNYSEELLKSKIFWNSYNLFNWVKNPQGMVKNTKCMQGKKPVSDIVERTDLVKFMKQFSKQVKDVDRRYMAKWLGYEYVNYREQGKDKVRDIMLERQGVQKEKK